MVKEFKDIRGKFMPRPMGLKISCTSAASSQNFRCFGIARPDPIFKQNRAYLMKTDPSNSA